VTAADFERQLGRNPKDWPLRLVYADWLDEQGDQELARAQRWMAKRERCPVIGMGFTIGWADYTAFKEPADLSQIPKRVLARMKGGTLAKFSDGTKLRKYRTRRAAERDLARALAALELSR
jgi:uncharacterized protein (TIGR02996 family)